MKNKIDNILLATLWFLASTLGICFWFNIQYGFNIFSDAHWRHLAYMQATQNPVRLSFYLSITGAIIIVIGGLYLLIRPHFRKIKIDTPQQPAPPTPQVPKSAEEEEFGMTRPKRLNVGAPPILQSDSHSTYTPAPVTAPVASASKAPAPQPAEDAELVSIFQDAGYTTKPAPRISGIQTSLLAIGAGETIWVGTIGTETSDLQNAIDAMTQLFLDTLEDIPITVHGFVINAQDASAPKSPDILTFANNGELRSYISENPNPPLNDEDQENFDAFSGYISTVIDYLRKL